MNGYFRPPDKTTWIEGRIKRPIITNREAHEEAAGMGLCHEFFALNRIDPDAPYDPAPAQPHHKEREEQGE